MRKRPPHIVVTTPESLYILLGSESGRRMLSTARTVIVDEIHALAPNKRGSHLALSLERLDALCGAPRRAHRPVGDAEADRGSRAIPAPASLPARSTDRRRAGSRDCCDRRHRPRARARSRARSAAIAARSGHVGRRLGTGLHRSSTSWSAQHRTTLIFVNTRRMAERVRAKHLSERLGKEAVAAHHGSLAEGTAPRCRAAPEARRAARAGRDRVARARHRHRRRRSRLPDRLAALDRGVPAARRPLGPRGRRRAEGRACSRCRATSWSNAAALLDAVRARRARPRSRDPEAPLDVLAQQIVAEVACQEWSEDALFELVRGAYPYRDADARRFRRGRAHAGRRLRDARGQRGAYLHRDAVNGVLRGRRGARLTAITSGGAIPDTADYDVVLEPQATKSARSTRTSRSRASPATSSSSATRRTGSCASSAGACASRTRRASRRRFRSGSAKRRAAPTSCRTRYRACARTFRRSSKTGSRKRPPG